MPTALPVDTVEVKVQFQDGTPVEGAGVQVDYEDYGWTDKHGLARVVVMPRAGHFVWAWKTWKRNMFVTHRWEGNGRIVNARAGTVTVHEHPVQ